MGFVTKFHHKKICVPLFWCYAQQKQISCILFRRKISNSLCNDVSNEKSANLSAIISSSYHVQCSIAPYINKTCSMNFFQVNSVRRRVNNDLSALAFFYFVPFVHFLDGSANNQKAIWSAGTRCNGISKRNKSIVHLLIRALLIEHCSSVLNCIQISEREC